MNKGSGPHQVPGERGPRDPHEAAEDREGATIPDTLDAAELYATVPETITPAPEQCPTVTGDQGPRAAQKSQDTLPLGSAPTLPTGAPRPRVSDGAASTRRQRHPVIGALVAGRFRITSRLGAGGMGTVFLAEQTAVGRQVVLKFLHPQFSHRPDLEQRFHREALAASQLNCPNTIVIHDFGQTEAGTLYMAMEYLEGRSLSELIDSTGALSPLRAIGITLQILTSLTEAHDKGIVHRDLKPENILLVPRGEVRDFVKVLDFGIAKIREQSQEPAAAAPWPPDGEPAEHRAAGGELESWDEISRELDRGSLLLAESEQQAETSEQTGPPLEAKPGASQPELTKHGEICGSPGYMAPEQIRGDAVDHRADLYAVGVILYQLLSGTNPFKGRSVPEMLLSTMDKQVPPLRESRPDLCLPRKLDELILRCLSKDSAGRPGSAEVLAEQLRQITPALARQQQEQERAMLELVGLRSRWRRHLRWALPAAVLALTALSIWLASGGGGYREGRSLAPGQRVLVATSASQVPPWVDAASPAGLRHSVRGSTDREAAVARGTAQILSRAADIPSKYDQRQARDRPAIADELRQVQDHARGLHARSGLRVQTFWTKIAVGLGGRRVSHVYDVHVFLARLSASQRQQLRHHFAKLRYDRYSFLVTEAVRKRRCQRAAELAARERETIEDLPSARRKSALSYLQYRLNKCKEGSQP